MEPYKIGGGRGAALYWLQEGIHQLLQTEPPDLRAGSFPSRIVERTTEKMPNMKSVRREKYQRP